MYASTAGLIQFVAVDPDTGAVLEVLDECQAANSNLGVIPLR